MLTGIIFCDNVVYRNIKLVCVVFTEDIIKRPAFEWDRVLSFAGIDINRAKLLKMSTIQNARLMDTIKYNDNIPEDLRNHGIAVLKSELENTNNLSDWPCLSFKSLDKSKLLLNASQLSPECSNKFVRCTVAFDQQGG